MSQVINKHGSYGKINHTFTPEDEKVRIVLDSAIEGVAQFKHNVSCFQDF